MTTLRGLFSASMEMTKSSQKLFSSIKDRKPVNWDELFGKMSELKRKMSEKFRIFEEPDLLNPRAKGSVETVRDAVLQKALLIGLETDFVSCYLEGIAYCTEMMTVMLSTMAKVYDDNKPYDMFALQQRVKTHVNEKHKKFLNKLDISGALQRHMELVLMEAISFCEDFKTFWMNFYASDEFYDLVDVGKMDFTVLNRLVLLKAEPKLKGYSCLYAVLGSECFEPVWMRLKRFSLNLGKYIFEYYKEIGDRTQEQLRALNDAMKSSRLMTQHIVVASVANLRYNYS